MNDQTPETLIYRPIPTSLGAKIVYGLVLVFLFIAPLIQPLKNIALEAIDPPFVKALWAISILVLLFIALQTKNKIIINSDGIEKHCSVFFKFYFQKKGIAAIQDYTYIPGLSDKNAVKKYFRILMRDGSGHNLNWSKYSFDQNFYEWVDRFPDYNSLRKEKIRSLSFFEKGIIYLPIIVIIPFIILTNFPDETLWRINISRQALSYLYIIPLVCCVLPIIHPDRFGFFTTDNSSFYFGKSHKPKIAAGLLAYVSSILFFFPYLSNLFDGNTLEKLFFVEPINNFSKVIFVYFAGLWLFMMANYFSYMIKADWASKIRVLDKLALQALFFIPLACIFLVDPVNSLYDFSKPTIYQTKVVKKSTDIDIQRIGYEILVKVGDEYKKSRYISKDRTIGPFPTSQEFYNKVKAGEVLCIYEYNGLLNRPWLRLDYCPEDLKSNETK